MRSLALCLVVSSVVACGDGSTDSSGVCGGANECASGAVCSDQGDGMRCYAAGVMDGQAMPADAAEPDPEPEELDACLVDNGGCAPQATCTSRDGSPECGPCPPGYDGDARGPQGCTDIDECADGSHDCFPEQLCSNKPGSYRCAPCPGDHRIDPALGCVRKATRLIGSAGDEHARGIAVDASDNVYVAGSTTGGYGTGPNRGAGDAFLVKYDSAGHELFRRQFGTAGDEIVTDVVSDADGNSWVFGNTEGAFEGNDNAGGYDLFIAKHDSSGELQWIRQFGSAADDYAAGLAISDAGNVAVASGYTEGDLEGKGNAGGTDLFVASFDAQGIRQWLHQLGGTQDDLCAGVAIDAEGGLIVAAQTDGSLAGNASAGQSDLVMIKYDAYGHQQWAHQLGSPAADSAAGVITVEGSNAYVAGATLGALPGAQSAGAQDGFLIKYDGSGTQHWTRQFGSAATDSVAGVAIDNFGSAYLTGVSEGGFGGNARGAFVMKYDSAGALRWMRPLGTSLANVPVDIAIDFHDRVYVTGFTSQGLDGLEIAGGNTDAFVIEFDSDGNPL